MLFHLVFLVNGLLFGKAQVQAMTSVFMSPRSIFSKTSLAETHVSEVAHGLANKDAGTRGSQEANAVSLGGGLSAGSFSAPVTVQTQPPQIMRIDKL